MARVRNCSNGKKNNGIFKRLQKGLFFVKKRSNSSRGQDGVPKDVKEGHFAVIACSDYVERRFVIPISCLGHPTFLRLLERAAEEYGFDHEGALMIPCRPSELEWLLKEEIRSRDYGAHWGSCKTMVETHRHYAQKLF